MCRVCAHKVWDRLYVVVNQEVRRVKLGVTSLDFRPRIADHRRDGYVQTLRALVIPDAPDLERAVLATLRLAEIPPVQGIEYYDLTALPVILDVVDHWPVETVTSPDSRPTDRSSPRPSRSS